MNATTTSSRKTSGFLIALLYLPGAAILTAWAVWTILAGPHAIHLVDVISVVGAVGLVVFGAFGHRSVRRTERQLAEQRLAR
ncbi:MAG: hypothetical protein ACTIKT_07110 [Microbacterium sp.]